MLEDVLKKWGAEEVSGLEVYRDMFRLGEGQIQKFDVERNNLKGNPLGYMRKNGVQKGEYRILFDDTFAETLAELQQADFCIVNGLTYFGRKNLMEHADRMFAMIFDLDGVTDTTLNNFLNAAFLLDDAYPIPNYIALSGHGVHLYYLFEEPLPLFPNIKMQLKLLKYALTERIWNTYTSTIKDPQIQGINQGFRVIGGKTKIEGVRVRAFRMNQHPFTMTGLARFVPSEVRDKIDESKIWKESKLTLAQAKKKWPEWYERRIVNKEPKGRWPYKRDLYEWWKRKIREGASYHHRYFCTMCLVIYGVKAGISREEVLKDALDLIPYMNTLSSEPFTEADVMSAMECYDERYCTFPREDIVKISGIQIQKNKRNGRKQAVHLMGARAIQQINDAVNGTDWRKGNGRKSKQAVVEEWQRSHPDGKKADCIKDTGLSKPTVYKHWKE